MTKKERRLKTEERLEAAGLCRCTRPLEPRGSGRYRFCAVCREKGAARARASYARRVERAEQREIRMNLDKKFHELFQPEPDGPDDFEPEQFARIKVVRLAAYGPLSRTQGGGTGQCMRLYTPEELDSLVTFQETFGGGSYEVRALRDDGRFYARRWFKTPGDSKAFVVTDGTGEPDAVATATQAAINGNGGGGGLDPMLALLVQMMSKGEERTMQMMTAMMGMQTQSTNAMMQVVAAIVSSNSGNKEPVGDLMRGFAEMARSYQPQNPVSPMDALKSTLEGAKLIREEVEASRPPEGPQEESTSTVIKAVGEAAMPLIMKAMEGTGAAVSHAASAPLFPVP